MTAAVIDSGTYKLEIDTGWDSSSFRLDDPIKGVLNNTTYLLGPGSDFADVTTGVLELRIFRGRRDIGDQFTAGTMSFTLNDQIAYGAFNPFNTDASTYDPANNQPGIAPMRRVRFYRYDSTNTAESLFQGYIVSYDYNFSLDGNDTVAVGCIDLQYTLSQTILDAWNVTEQLSSARVVEMLARSEVDAFQGLGQQSIETGVATLGGSSPFNVPQGTNVNGYLTNIMDAEQGRAFVDRSGIFTFQKRISTTLAGAVVDFGDNDPAHTPYDQVTINFGADKVINRASVTHLGSTSTQTAEDLASQAQYLIQATSYNDSLVHDNAAALALAEYLIKPQPTPVLTSVSAPFQMLSNAERDTVAIVDIGETISIEKTIQTGVSSTSVIAQESFVEGVEHVITYASPHRVTFYTTPTTVYQLFILDSSTLDTIYALS
jgi:hypothetical protein